MDASLPLTVLVHLAAPAAPSHEYLLLRRTPDRGGYWLGASGAVRAGEALDEAAVRVLAEQTRLTPIRLIPAEFHHTIRAKRRSRPTSVEHVFLALMSAKVDPTINPAEDDAWDWYSFDEAVVWLRRPESVEALRRCEKLFAPTASAEGG